MVCSLDGIFVLLALVFFTATGIDSLQCSKDQLPQPQIIPRDQSWIEYIRFVYGDDSVSDLNKYDINFLYRNSPVQVLTHEWGHKRPLSKLPVAWGDTYFHFSDRVYKDHEWAEVNRYSTYFLNSYKETEEVWEEGLSRGFPGRSKDNSTKVPYGCWFNLAQGSGIFVNVGKTLVTTDKYRSNLFQELGLTSKGCWPSETNDRSCYDRNICTAALAKGYDSVQVTGRSEIVLCSGRCATETLRYACPPVELRSGVNASRPCACSDESHLLNCGKHPNSVPDLRWNFPSNGQPENPRHTLCISREAPEVSIGPFDMTVAFTSGVLLGSVPFKALRRARESLIDKSAVLLDVGVLQNNEAPPVSAGAGRNRAAAPSSSAEADDNQGNQELRPRNLRGAVSVEEEGARELRATPLGPHPHRSLVPPPVGSWSDTSGEVAAGRSVPSAIQPSYPDERRERHQRLSHAGWHSRSRIPTPADLIIQALRTAISSSGYQAVVADRRAENITAGLAVPLLYPAAVDAQLQTVLNVGDVKLGLLVYIERARGVSVEEHLRKHADEATCLRNAGVDVVIMMGATRQPYDAAFLRGLYGYVDIVASAVPPEAAAPQSCNGTWHALNAEQLTPAVVQIHSNSNLLGAIRIVRDKQGRYSVSSKVLKI